VPPYPKIGFIKVGKGKYGKVESMFNISRGK
jgi:hypothetical protein